MSTIFKEQIDLQQVDSHTYTAQYHEDWCLGPVQLHGGCVATVVHAAAAARFRSTLKEQSQPDVHTLQIAFFRACKKAIFTIKITDLKIGRGSSFIQVILSQDGRRAVAAFATSINFERTNGPSAKTDQSILFNPMPFPPPDFSNFQKQSPDNCWVASHEQGDFVGFSHHLLYLYPRQEFPVD